jgi:hypothetical protein
MAIEPEEIVTVQVKGGILHALTNKGRWWVGEVGLVGQSTPTVFWHQIRGHEEKKSKIFGKVLDV